MSNVSIFETRWIDLVFEGKNKEYGAYQLRQENPKTTVKALLVATTLFCLLITIPMILNQFGQKPIASSEPIIGDILTITDVVFPPKKEPEKAKALPPARKEEPKKEITKENLVDPTVVEKEKAKTDIATNEEAETNPNEGSTEGTGTTPSTGGVEGGIIGGEGKPDDGGGGGEGPRGPYGTAHLDKMPAYPGGIENFYKYVAKNFKAPEMDNEKAIKVYVSFVIEKDGTMTDIRVPRNPGYGLDKEAIRVLKSLKVKWEPGMIAGKPVRTAYNLPINIQLR
ncbi:protein TonB [Flavobacterium arsenatis]|uniref:Protein TonB n=1 Tax=Flavobacterium arsenatis TaxID=1484332 RepID=A0ABU1TSQ2_9FLAO|nr:energy transducer TonB [Flavobacterium arsenatis]MDR6968876.1 protein TonB [Flavobacterium arsenatis]